MEKVTTVMKILTNIKQFSEIDATNIGQASPGKEEQPGSTSGNVPPPNPNSSVGADDQKETLENAPTCILTIIGSSIGWLQVRTKHAYLTLNIADPVEKTPVSGLSSNLFGHLFCWHANAEVIRPFHSNSDAFI